MEIFTIGAYNSSEDDFFQKIIDNNIDTFCDIRQRRGVRGSKYSFVNSKKLQEKLSQIGVKYEHFLDLAPTKDIRNVQKDSDSLNSETKKKRLKLSESFVNKYKEIILKNFELEKFIKDHEYFGVNNIVFFCVEEHNEACHRSILTDELEKKFHYKITHL